jgi:porphobilinogen synthase
MGFPKTRLRRLRKNEALRRLVRETSLCADGLVYPLFVCAGEGLKKAIRSLEGCFHFSPDMAAAEAKEVAGLGIPAVLLFGLPERKDQTGSAAWDEDGVVQQTIRRIKDATPELVVITDVCLCEYTSHGHCGVVVDGQVDNDATNELLAKVALSHARAGADMVAPSDMMDGRVGVIRRALDEGGFSQTAIMAYSAKFASCFYGPFREAADCAPSFGDRRSYQMDPANSDEAMREIQLDIEEGADIVMVKPALCYLDIIYRAKQRFGVPIAAYNVSGEYMMVQSAAKAGLLDKQKAVLEMLGAIKRAGADIIITYFAKDVAGLLRRQI